MHLRALGKRRKTVETIVKTRRTISTTGRSSRSYPLPETLADSLHQVDRTYVLHRGRRLSYFGGCDYFRLSSHPDVLRALHEDLDRFGLNVAASRKTTGNHALYGQLERKLAEFFGVEAAVLVSNGYMTNLAVAQALAGEFTHALIDERAHASLFDAAKLLDCLVLPFKHRDTGSAAKAARQAGRAAKILLLTDGLFSHSGEVAPLEEYLRLFPASAMLLVDDAHGAGTLGRTGRGTTELLSVSGRRVIRTITLSKAFGVYGGAVIGSLAVRNWIVARSRLFVGNTPLPLPLAAAALASLKVLRNDLQLRRRLLCNTSYVKAALREAGLPVNNGPGPIIPFVPRNRREADQLVKRLLVAGIHPPLINYLGGPEDGYFRFAISSEHTPEQLDALARVLGGR
jgi:7-keto-8-aminopelargonate synthetase-like enzyme